MTTLQLWPATSGPAKFYGQYARTTVGTEFKVTTGTWWVSEIRVWRGSWDTTGPITARVYVAGTGAVLAGTDVTITPRGLGWQTAVLPTPVLLTTNTLYRVVYWTPTGPVGTALYWTTGSGSSGVTNSALTAPNRAGSTGTTQGARSAPGGPALTFPTVDGAGMNWWADITVTDQDPATATPDPFTTAVTGVRRRPVASLLVDWDNDGYQHPLADLTDTVNSITVDRSATGDLPNEVSLVEGTTIAEVTATLEGAVGDTTVFDALAPYDPTSDLYRYPVVGTPVAVDLGFITPTGPDLVPQVVGNIRSVKPDSKSRTVEVSVLDPADQLRAPITLPAFGMFIQDFLTSNHKFYVNTQAVVDYVLRKNGIYASVAPHPNAQIACTGHGWLVAETGRSAVPRGIANVIPDETWWVPGPFDLLAVRGDWDGGAYTEFFARDPFVPRPGNGIGMSAWLRIGNDMGITGGGSYVFQLIPLSDPNELWYNLLVYDDGSVSATMELNGTPSGNNYTTSTTTQWRFVGVHYAHLANGTTLISVKLDGTVHTTTVTTPRYTSPPAAFLQCTAWTQVGWSDFCCWFDPAAPTGDWPGETVLNQADLDVGLNNMTHLPDLVGGDSWQTISDCVAAEYGLVGFDETGRAYFQSRDTITTGAGTVEEELTADRSLIDLTLETSADSVRNVVTTETTSGFLSVLNTIFDAQASTQFNTYPGYTTYQIDLPYGAIGYTTQLLPRIANADWSADTLFGFVAVDAYNPTVEISSTADVTVLFAMSGDRKGLITVRNNSPNYVQFSTTGGQPALRVQGYLLELNPTTVGQVVAPGSVETFGERVLALGASPWRQVDSGMRSVSLRLLNQLSWPVPVIDQFTAVGNPARTVGDTLRLIDPDGHGSIRATLVKLSRQYSEQGMQDTLTVRPVGPPGVLILDDPELGVLDDPDLWLIP